MEYEDASRGEDIEKASNDLLESIQNVLGRMEMHFEGKDRPHPMALFEQIAQLTRQQIAIIHQMSIMAAMFKGIQATMPEEVLEESAEFVLDELRDKTKHYTDQAKPKPSNIIRPVGGGRFNHSPPSGPKGKNGG